VDTTLTETAYLRGIIEHAIALLLDGRTVQTKPGPIENYLVSSLAALDTLNPASPEPARCYDCSTNADRIAALDAECVTLCQAVDDLRHQLAAHKAGAIAAADMTTLTARRLDLLTRRVSILEGNTARELAELKARVDQLQAVG
jgi:hypothetical protein